MFQQLWLLVFAAHVACAVAWLWLMPGGFPSTSQHYAPNQLLPYVPIALALVALFARGRFALLVVPAIQLMFPMFWMACAISARLTFPESIGGSWNVAFMLSSGLVILWVRQHRRAFPKLAPLFALPAIWAGWVVPPTQRALPPATQPSQEALFDVPVGGRTPSLIKLGKDAQLHPSDGRLVVRRGELVVTVQPLLTLAERSPDRFWTSLAPQEDKPRPTRMPVATAKDGLRWKLSFRDEDRSVLDAGLRGSVVELDARSSVPRDVYVHGSQLAEVTLQGHRAATVTFSAIPGRRIELPGPSRPACFAYLDQAEQLHVVQAAKHRAGPYTELAVGPLKRGQPLGLTIHDTDGPAFLVTLDDFSAQASTQLSPTAGWGVPVNAIELSRVAEPEGSPIAITATLAASTIGRGSNSVGISAGVYRNRMSVTVLPAPGK